MKTLPPMPAVVARRPYEDHKPKGYLESFDDYVANNQAAVEWFLENHAAIATHLKITPISLPAAIKTVEAAHFRTEHDSGAHPHARLILNAFRRIAELPYVGNDDLPSWDQKRKGYYMPPASKLLTAPDALAKGGKV